MGTRAVYVSLVLANAVSFAIAAVILLTLPAVPPARWLPRGVGRCRVCRCRACGYRGCRD